MNRAVNRRSAIAVARFRDRARSEAQRAEIEDERALVFEEATSRIIVYRAAVEAAKNTISKLPKASSIRRAPFLTAAGYPLLGMIDLEGVLEELDEMRPPADPHPGCTRRALRGPGVRYSPWLVRGDDGLAALEVYAADRFSRVVLRASVSLRGDDPEHLSDRVLLEARRARIELTEVLESLDADAWGLGEPLPYDSAARLSFETDDNPWRDESDDREDWRR